MKNSWKPNPRLRPDRSWDRDDLLMKLWFGFCLLVGLVILGGMVAMVIYVLPHLVAMIDRIGR